MLQNVEVDSATNEDPLDHRLLVRRGKLNFFPRKNRSQRWGWGTAISWNLRAVLSVWERTVPGHRVCNKRYEQTTWKKEVEWLHFPLWWRFCLVCERPVDRGVAKISLFSAGIRLPLLPPALISAGGKQVPTWLPRGKSIRDLRHIKES